jgi:hypothetical protein
MTVTVTVTGASFFLLGENHSVSQMIDIDWLGNSSLNV